MFIYLFIINAFYLQAMKFGHSVHIDVVFQQTHIRKDTGEFVDERSRRTHVSFFSCFFYYHIFSWLSLACDFNQCKLLIYALMAQNIHSTIYRMIKISDFLILVNVEITQQCKYTTFVPSDVRSISDIFICKRIISNNENTSAVSAAITARNVVY